MQVVFNGEFMPAEEATIGITEPGVLYGEGCFETLRLHQGKPRFFAEHWQRFTQAIQTLGITIDTHTEIVCEQIIGLAQRNQIANGVARFSCHQTQTGADFAIIVSPPRRHPQPASFRVTISQWPHPGPSSYSGIKHNNYALFRAAHQQARADGWDECLLINAQQEIVEGAISNVFWVDEENHMCTPPLGCGALPGIIRARIIKLFPKVVERAPHRDELARAKEVFLTNSSFEIMPVSELDGRRFTKSAERTTCVMARFQEAYPDC
ncbi:aminotransferase class IV [Cerasicoccus arenae]|uniref:branched-chain-amino-acid transaminase n=1 Tax=Cerasicoccus arenae TaxID=424488 RepID=A0A8J3DEY4_9BACT|nr:aminotransferase class IV [Cerasicoccus arenae]MBK1859592.1 aminotransferase class IV [Cerasicoccus arenae]GHB92906.1 branched chain amino acid aminotransferase [Cerasicoccus arenae]